MRKSVYSDEYKSVLSVLIEARKTARLTQVDVGARLDRPQNFVSYVERGERRLDVIDFIEYARAMGQDPKALLDQIEERLTAAKTGKASGR